MDLIPIVLVGLVVFQQVYFMRQIQKLLDKLMSRNYSEYKQADKPVIVNRSNQSDMSLAEDLGPLQEIQSQLI